MASYLCRISIRFDDFANKELLKKGLYRIRVSILNENDAPTPESCRSQASSVQSQSRGIVVADSELGAEPGGLDDVAFSTRSVFMRFADEVFELSETVDFSYRIPSLSMRMPGRTLVLKLELLRADCLMQERSESENVKSGDEHGMTVGDGRTRKAIKRTGLWVVASTRQIQLPSHACSRGIHACVPILWDSMHLASTTLSMHTAVSGVAFFRPERPSRPSLIPSGFYEHLAEEYSISGKTYAADGDGAQSAPAGTGSAKEDASARRTGTRPMVRPGSAFIAAGLFATVAGKMSRALVGLGNGLLHTFLRPGAHTSMNGAIHFKDDGLLPSALVLYLNACAEVDAQAHSAPEALFPSFCALKVDARSARLTHLYDTLVAGYSALHEEDLRAADGAFSAASVLADSIERSDAVESVRTHDQIGITANEAQSAHSRWLGVLVDSFIRLRLAIHRLTGDGIPPLRPLSLHGAGTYCPTQFGPRTRHPPFSRAHNGGEAGKLGWPLGVDGLPGSAAYQDELALLATEMCACIYSEEGLVQLDRTGEVECTVGSTSVQGLEPDAFGCSSDSARSGPFAAPFAVRAVKALYHPESAARALLHECELVEARIVVQWRALQSSLTAQRTRADAMMQAAYKAEALARMRQVIVEVHCKADESRIALQQLKSITDASRRASVDRRGHGGIAANNNDVDLTSELDPILAGISSGAGEITAKVVWYTPFEQCVLPAIETSSASAVTDLVVASTEELNAIERRPALSEMELACGIDDEGVAMEIEAVAEVVSPWSARADSTIDIEHGSSMAGSAKGADVEDAPTSPNRHAQQLAEPAFTPLALNSLIGDYFIPNHAAAIGSAGAVVDVPSSVLSRCPEVTGRVHVVVFMNGLGGSVYDTRILRALLKVQEPHLLCTPCAANQGLASEGDLVAAGVRMALEVSSFLAYRVREDGVTIQKLSFIVFSLGGVVTRIALRHPALAAYAHLLHAFVSIASPHMGLLFTPAIVSTSLALLQHVKATPALAQLALADVPVSQFAHSNLHAHSEGAHGEVASVPAPVDPAGHFADTLLYLLATGWAQASAHAQSVQKVTGSEILASSASGQPTHTRSALFNLRAANLSPEPNGVILSSFKSVVLIGSPQDAYAPYHSCMVGMTHATSAATAVEAQASNYAGASPQAVAYKRMLHGFWKGVQARGTRVARCSVVFPGLGSSLSSRLSVDGMLGRQAHVAFLESESVAALVAIGLAKLWEPGDCQDENGY